MPACLHFVMEYPKLSKIIHYWINCKVNANETNRLAIARAHFFQIAFSYHSQSEIRVLAFISSKIFILYYFQIDLTLGLVKY